MVLVRRMLLACLLAFFFAGCNAGSGAGQEGRASTIPALVLDSAEQAWVDQCREQGGLRVASVLGTGVFELDLTGKYQGFHANLARRMGERLNVPVNFIESPFSGLFFKDGAVPATARDPAAAAYKPDIFTQADIIAYDLTALPWRQRLMHFVPLYPVKHLIITRRDVNVRQLGDLQGLRIISFEHSSNEERLYFLRDKLGLDFSIQSIPLEGDAFAMLREGKANAFTRDSNAAIRLLPGNTDLNVTIPVSEASDNNWAVATDTPVLEGLLRKYLAWARLSGDLDKSWSEAYQMSMAEYEKLIGVGIAREPEFSPRERAELARIREAGGLRVAIHREQGGYEEDSNGHLQGVHYNLLLAVAAYLDLPIKLEPVKFTEFFTQSGVFPGQIATSESYRYKPDVLLRNPLYVGSFSPLPWRKKILEFIPIFPNTQVLVMRKADRSKDIATLLAGRFSLIPATSYDTWYQQQGASGSTIIASAGVEAVSMVADGRADVTLSDANLMLLRKREFANLDFYPAGTPAEELSWGVDKDYPVLASALARTVAYLRDNGTFDVIWQAYYHTTMQEYLDMLNAPPPAGGGSP